MWFLRLHIIFYSPSFILLFYEGFTGKFTGIICVYFYHSRSLRSWLIHQSPPHLFSIKEMLSRTLFRALVSAFPLVFFACRSLRDQKRQLKLLGINNLGRYCSYFQSGRRPSYFCLEKFRLKPGSISTSM